MAGFVVNEKKEVLVIQEKWLRKMKFIHWKFPGGVCDPGQQMSCDMYCPSCDYHVIHRGGPVADSCEGNL